MNISEYKIFSEAGSGYIYNVTEARKLLKMDIVPNQGHLKLTTHTSWLERMKSVINYTYYPWLKCSSDYVNKMYTYMNYNIE
jgi:hypothetical protein